MKGCQGMPKGTVPFEMRLKETLEGRGGKLEREQ